MDLFNSLNSSQILMLSFLGAALACAFLTGACLEYRRHKVVQIYMGIMLMYIGWSLFNLMVIFSPSIEAKELYARLKFICISPLPPLWIYFLRELFPIPGQKKWGWKYALLFALPTVVLICCLTPELYSLILHHATPYTALGIETIQWQIGPIAKLHIAYSYSVLAYGIYICTRGVRSQNDQSAHYGKLMISSLLIYIIPENIGLHLVPQIRFLGIPLLSQIFSAMVFYYILHRQQTVRSFSINNDLLFEFLPTPAVLIDQNNRVAFYNSRAAKIFNLNIASVGELYEKALPSYLVENLPSPTMTPPGLIIEQRGPSGTTKYFEVVHEVFSHPRFPGKGSLLILSDVTELKRSTQANQRLLSLMSHDLLGNLSGLSELLHKKSERHWELISDAARSSADLVKNILLWSANQGDLYKLAKEPVNVQELTNLSLNHVRPLLIEKNIRIAGSALREDFIIDVDLKMFQAILRNLLSNALKYAPRDSQIHIHFEVLNNEAHWSVQDQGPGIEPDRIREILSQSEQQPFGKMHSEGYGIGLFLVVQFLKLHDGRLDIQNAGTSGCRVTAIFPV